MARITPCLWFDDEAEAAADLYIAVFPNSRITTVQRYGPGGMGEEGAVMMVAFELDGQPWLALNGGPAHAGRFTEGTSFMIDCDGQEQVDHYWDNLSDGGEEGRCGWLKDRFGLSWQVVPRQLPQLLGTGDADARKRVFESMLTMRKLDVAALEAAAAG